MKKLILIILLLLATGCQKNHYQKITADEAYQMLKENPEVLVVDVRDKIEYNQGHIKNAILLPVDVIQEQIHKKIPNQQAQIILYCNSGKRDEIAAKKLVEEGYQNVYIFGGLNQWKEEVVK